MKTELQKSDENRQILEEASTWFVECRIGTSDGQARRQFAQWLRRSPEHIRAYMEIAASYARLPHPKRVPAAHVERLIARARSRNTVVPGGLVSELSAAESEDRVKRGCPRSARTVGLFAALAATTACMLIGGGVLMFVNRYPSYQTQTGEQRAITLADGSRVELNARSAVRVIYTDRSRIIELQGGQAFFSVAKSPQRPFIVRSAWASVRALGTQFDMYKRDSGTTVTVVEGRVALQSASENIRSVGATGSKSQPAPAGQAFELAAGEQAVITAKAILKAPSANVAAATAWIQGQLEFDETPLSQVVAEFNRYSPKPLVLVSGSLRAVRISGVYSTTNTASLLVFLRSQPDIVVSETDTAIRLTRK